MNPLSAMTPMSVLSGELEEGHQLWATRTGRSRPLMNLAASLIPDGVYLSWTAVKDDEGFAGYQYSTDGEEWDDGREKGHRS